jgi:ComF family protein
MPLTTVLRGLVDLLAPRRCAACDLELAPDEGIGDVGDPAGFCEACAPLLEALDGAEARHAAYRYGGPLADAIRRFKYGGQAELAPVLGRLMAPRARALAGRLDAVAPVPLHPRRLRERGFDQASLLAAALSEELGVPRRLDLVVRARATVPQASLDRPARLANVDGAFEARLAARGLVVLVVDDVRTTGATAAAVSAALLDAGARAAHSLALALADGPALRGGGPAERRP